MLFCTAMKKLVAILIMFLLTVQTVQFAISSLCDEISSTITLDEDRETKDVPVKKLQKEYPYYSVMGNAILLSTNALYQVYRSFIPLAPSLKNPTPPPDQSC
jgi:hypothetical protein